MDLTGFAKVLGGAKRLEGSGANRPTNVSRMSGTAVSDSVDGRVLVRLDAQVFSSDDSQYVELTTSDNVRDGDSVYVDMVGADGKGKSLMISGAPGSGDRQQGEIEDAATTATRYVTETSDEGIMVHPEDDDTTGWHIGAALELLKAGASVFKVWLDNAATKVRIGSEDSGNVLIDDDSVDIRNGLDANDNPVTLASFAANLIELGKNSASSIIRMCDGVGTFWVATRQFIISTGEPSQVSPQIRLLKYDNNDGDPTDDGGSIEIVIDRPAQSGDVETSIRLENSPSNGSVMTLVANGLNGDDETSAGPLKPVGVYHVTMTTPANNGADYNVSLYTQSSGDVSFYDANYAVLITPEDAPAGFTHISYVVTNKSFTGFTIHAYNDYSSSITQTLNVMVVHY